MGGKNSRFADEVPGSLSFVRQWLRKSGWLSCGLKCCCPDIIKPGFIKVGL